MALNEMQQQAVECTEGPLLILAGAGSGKTTVLVNRVQHIIEDGLALPWQVLAITFTNKAAGELKERLIRAIGEEASSIWAFTFHSCCARILRRFGDRIGYSNHFTIYDTDDQKRVMKHCQKSLGLTDKIIHHKSILSAVSTAKDSLIDYNEYKKEAVNDFRKSKIADCYEMYQKELLKSDAMDFDDILFFAYRILTENASVVRMYNFLYKYICIDEAQDFIRNSSGMLWLMSIRTPHMRNMYWFLFLQADIKISALSAMMIRVSIVSEVQRLKIFCPLKSNTVTQE